MAKPYALGQAHPQHVSTPQNLRSGLKESLQAGWVP